MSLEINTNRSKLRDFVEKIVKNKLGMHYPSIMHGTSIIYECGDDIEEDFAQNYALNLEKVYNLMFLLYSVVLSSTGGILMSNYLCYLCIYTSFTVFS